MLSSSEYLTSGSAAGEAADTKDVGYSTVSGSAAEEAAASPKKSGGGGGKKKKKKKKK